jgi:hypothetical protein
MVESFCGGAAIFLAKTAVAMGDPSGVAIASDRYESDK